MCDITERRQAEEGAARGEPNQPADHQQRPGRQAAVTICRERGDQLDLANIDMIMPGRDGQATLRAMRQIQPDLRTILSSGYGIDGRAQEILDEGMQGFIQKPYRLSELAEAVKKGLNG